MERKPERIFRSRRKRSESEERLYHGNPVTVEQESAEAENSASNPSTTTVPRLDANTVGPLPGQDRVGAGAWGTISRETRLSSEQMTLGFAVAAVDGRKRAVRGGSSEDAFTAVADFMDIKRRVGDVTCKQTETQLNPEASEITNSFSIAGRIFHLFGIFDGHRSNHAARFCAERLKNALALRLSQRGILLSSEKLCQEFASEADADVDRDATSEISAAILQEEHAVSEAFSSAIISMDEEFCKRRWASLVRDNGKKFYVMGVNEVPDDFNLGEWDASHSEEEWRQQLALATAQYGRRAGLKEAPPGADSELRRFMVDNQKRWHLYKKEIFPGSTLCAVLVDENSGRLYCANVGDSAAMMYRLCDNSSQAMKVVTQAGAQMARTESSTTAYINRSSTDGCIIGKDEYNTGKFGTLSKLTTSEVLLEPGEFLPLSQDHKPSDPQELQRVWSTKEGFVEVHGVRVLPHNVGSVTEMVRKAHAEGKKALYRINKDLSLSRAVGDADLKPFGVVATPDIVVHRMKRNQSCRRSFQDGRSTQLHNAANRVLVIASDGVWDSISLSKCALIVQGAASTFEFQLASSQLQVSAASEQQPTVTLNGPAANFAEETAMRIVEAAQPGTNDDITAVVVVFN